MYILANLERKCLLMSIESDLKKDGITVIEPLDTTTVNVIAKNVSKKIVAAFSNLGFDFDTLYERFSKLPMYIADMPEGMSEASYFYKNSAIYFRDGMGLADLEKFAVHELIHNFQEQKNEKGDLTRLGLCTFKGSKPTGMALNEAAVQLLASNILENTFETATYYDITFSTVSPNCYPLLCNLIYQMAYVTGEEVLFESTFNSNDHFKNKFTALCGENVYNQISNYFDKILETEEKIIKISNKIQKTELSTTKVDSLYRKSDELKKQLKSAYFSTQELIINSYFTNSLKTLITSDDVDRFRKKLYSFQDIIGTTTNYFFFNNYYIQVMEKLDSRYDSLSDYLDDDNTYLIPKKENKFTKIINYIKKLIWKKESVR